MYCFLSKQKKIPINEIRQLVITSYSNTINKTNEGIKHASYNRVLLNKKQKNIKQICKTN
jgi:hypothetical protein